MRYAIIYKGKEVVAEIELSSGAGLFYNDREYTCKVFNTELEATQLKDFLKVEKPIKANFEQILEIGKQEFSQKETLKELQLKVDDYLRKTEYPQIEEKVKEWQPDEKISAGDLRTWKGLRYEALIDHISDKGTEPPSEKYWREVKIKEKEDEKR